MFCDARGSPPHVAAVLFIAGRVLFTHMTPAASLLAHFKRRRDNQIMGLELLGVSLGLSTFESLLAGRSVVIHCDNSGAEAGESCCGHVTALFVVSVCR